MPSASGPLSTASWQSCSSGHTTMGSDLDEPIDEASEVSEGSAEEWRQAIHKVLEEVLWSAVMLKRSAAASLDVQDALLWLLPREDLACGSQCCQPSGIARSLLQRLGKELPAIFEAVTSVAAPPG